jgi:hypothetical protein
MGLAGDAQIAVFAAGVWAWIATGVAARRRREYQQGGSELKKPKNAVTKKAPVPGLFAVLMGLNGGCFQRL